VSRRGRRFAAGAMPLSRVLAVDACSGGGQTCPGLGTAGRLRVPIPGRVFDWWRPPKCADLAASGLTEQEYLAFLRPLLEFLDQNSLMHKPINSTIQFIYDNFTVRTYESFFQSCQSTAVVKVLRQGFSSTDTITCTALSSTRSEVSSFPCHRQPHVSSAHSKPSNHTLRQLVHLHLFFLQMG
jgi:hypothetical protein